MEYRQLGNTPVSISRIGFGGGPAGGHDYGPVDEQEWKSAVHDALDHGINFFDVANVYGLGRVEALLSDALGHRRHEVVIATKGGLVWDEHRKVHRDLRKSTLVASIDASLRRLRVDTIPLYQIHWPDPETPIEETLETLAACREQGKFRYLGVSNFSLDLMRQTHSIMPITSLQVAFNLLCREPEGEMFSWGTSSRVSILAHSGLAQGLLAGQRPIGQAWDGNDVRSRSPYFSENDREEKQAVLDAIRRLSAKHDRPFSSVSIRWILDHPEVGAVLVGIKNRQQLAENLKAVDWQLSSDEWETLSQLSSLCPSGLAGTPAHSASHG
jgi:aryl-alcohol dehydrogenase-like predicted oxidoreductase